MGWDPGRLEADIQDIQNRNSVTVLHEKISDICRLGTPDGFACSDSHLRLADQCSVQHRASHHVFFGDRELGFVLMMTLSGLVLTVVIVFVVVSLMLHYRLI
jgi:hypothetical protein